MFRVRNIVAIVIISSAGGIQAYSFDIASRVFPKVYEMYFDNGYVVFCLKNVDFPSGVKKKLKLIRPVPTRVLLY